MSLSSYYFSQKVNEYNIGYVFMLYLHKCHAFNFLENYIMINWCGVLEVEKNKQIEEQLRR